MKPLLVFIASVLILAALAIAFPHVMLNPGQLTNGHKTLDHNCLACHTPFRSVSSVQCISCHKQSDISVKTVAGALLPKKSSKALFHKGLADNSCIECHTDHQGRVATKALKTFKHESLSRSLSNNCITCHTNQTPKDALHKFAKGNCTECHTTKQWKPATFDHKKITASAAKECITCHKADQPNDKLHLNVSTNCVDCHRTTKWKPATFDHKNLAATGGKACITCHKADRPSDKLHLNVSTNCVDCHRTTKWKPATFDHKNLAATGGKACITCHKADQPNDTLHRQSQAGCGTCHSSAKWKPATFDHNRYFRLDSDHRTSCKTCHTDPGNYKQYTCYSCHEHSLSNIAAEHRKEGIVNYQNCMKCHRNGKAEERGDD